MTNTLSTVRNHMSEARGKYVNATYAEHSDRRASTVGIDALNQSSNTFSSNSACRRNGSSRGDGDWDKDVVASLTSTGFALGTKDTEASAMGAINGFELMANSGFDVKKRPLPTMPLVAASDSDGAG